MLCCLLTMLNLATSGQSEREDQADEGHGKRAEHVPGTSE